MVLKPGREAEAEAIFRKWELDFAVIGEVTDTGHMVLEFERRGRRRHPARPARRRGAAATSGPTRSRKPPEPLTDIPESTDIAADLLKLMASPNLASRRWMWEQYDQSVGADTVQRPGGDAAVVRVHGIEEGAGDHHRLHAALLLRRPVRGREAGGRRGLSQPLRGRREAAGDHQLPQLRQPAAARDHGPVRRLRRRHGRSLPRARLPGRERQRLALQRDQERGRHRASRSCPPRRSAASACSTIGRRARRSGSRPRARQLVLIGHSTGHVGQSLWLEVCHGRREGAPPPVDLARRAAAGELVRQLIARRPGHAPSTTFPTAARAGRHRRDGARRLGLVRASALANRCQSRRRRLFGEDQGRVVVTTRDRDADRQARRRRQPSSPRRSARSAATRSRGPASPPASPTSAPRTRASSPS